MCICYFLLLQNHNWMDFRLTFCISLVELCDFCLPQLADSKWICWNNKQQAINNLWFRLFSSHITIFFPCLWNENQGFWHQQEFVFLSPMSVFHLLSEQQQLWVSSYFTEIVFLLFQLPISKAMGFLSELLWLGWLTSTFLMFSSSLKLLLPLS